MSRSMASSSECGSQGRSAASSPRRRPTASSMSSVVSRTSRMSSLLTTVPTMAVDAHPLRLGRSMPWSRVMGLRSIFAKTVRDSRRAALVVGGLGGLFMFATAAPYGLEFGTLALRQQFMAGMTALPLAMRGLLGEPINIETLGGFISWRVRNTLPVVLGLWSGLALWGTLAGGGAQGRPRPLA